MNIATQLLITTLITSPASTGVRDLCEVVHRETGVPTICQPHKQGAPVYDAEVCCAGGSCFAASYSACREGEVLYYCGLGEDLVTGEVACYFEVPSYCDVFACDLAVAPHPQQGSMCCNQGICWNYRPSGNDCEIGDLYWCNSGMSNADGTVTCLDDES
jgi:hypothetical protein